MNNKEKLDEVKQPSLDVLESVLKAEDKRVKRLGVIRKTVMSLIVVAAVAVLFVLLLFPILKINGSSMTNSLNNGDIVVAMKSGDVDRGDIIAFYYNNNVLVKRVIAKSGDWVNIEADGTVYVNEIPLQEDYVSQKDYGECDIALPYQVPEGKVFVLGDRRSTSIDSRNSAIGCISNEMIIGKLLFRIWPFTEIGSF